MKKIKEKGPAFMLMENVQAFQAAIKKYGVPDMEIFQTADLFEGRNIPQVLYFRPAQFWGDFPDKLHH